MNHGYFVREKENETSGFFTRLVGGLALTVGSVAEFFMNKEAVNRVMSSFYATLNAYFSVEMLRQVWRKMFGGIAED